MTDHLPAPLREFIELYSAKYAEVRFPDLDLAILEQAADEVAQALARVAEAEAEVERIREQAKAVEAELTQKVVRGLAFLKIYVEGNDAEYAQLDELNQALLTRKPTRKSPSKASSEDKPAGERGRRGRKPKATAESVAEEVALNPADIAEADLPSSVRTEFEGAAE